MWLLTGTHEYRGFMSKAWFTDRNAGALRGFLRSIILKAFAEQACSSVVPVFLWTECWKSQDSSMRCMLLGHSIMVPAGVGGLRSHA